MDKLFDRFFAFLTKVFRNPDEFFIADPECKLPACRIRPITEADFEACEEIYRLNEAAHFPPDHFAAFQSYLHSGLAYFLAAEVEGAVRAFGGVAIHPHPAVEYASLVFGMVHPEFRKQGFGTALLLARLASLPRPKNLWIIGITTTRGSETFYGRFGFSFVGRFLSSLKIELDSYYVKMQSGWRGECRTMLERASIRFESNGTDIPRVKAEEVAPSGTYQQVRTANPVYAAWMVRWAGAALGCFGLAFAALVIRGFANLIKGVSVPEFTSLLALGMLTALALFCLSVGGRFLLLRPNSRGSALGPGGWYILGISFAAFGLAAGVTDLIHGGFAGLLVLLLFMPFSLSCIFLARRISKMEKQYGKNPPPAQPSTSPAVAPDVSGCDVIEIFNDDKTPMEFVVNVLKEFAGVERPAAIKLMLEIHNTGSAVIPCASPEEAARMVAEISASAREAGHPLRCEIAVPVATIDDETGPVSAS